MSKFNLLSLGLIVGGIVVAIFQAISSMMTEGEITWEPQTPVTVLGPENFEWIDGISVSFVQGIFNTLVNTQIFILMIAVGLFLVVLGMFLNR